MGLCLWVGCHPKVVERPVQNWDASQSLQRMKTDVFALSADSMGGRPPGTDFETRAARYISLQWEAMGIKPQFQSFQYAHKSILQKSRNIIAYLDFGADSTVLIGAHYDHLGDGGEKSLEIRNTGLHPGADDNASGVALLLELGRWLASQRERKYNYAFVAFSAHEIGLYGSKALAESPTLKEWKVAWMLNFDMVGRLSSARILRMSFCPDFPHLPMMDTPPGDLHIRPDVDFETYNDYSSFCEAGYPALSLTTGIHADYHRMSDTPDKINYEGLVMVLEFVKRMI